MYDLHPLRPPTPADDFRGHPIDRYLALESVDRAELHRSIRPVPRREPARWTAWLMVAAKFHAFAGSFWPHT